MAYFDYPLDKLCEYRPDRNEPNDFDDFWKRTLRESRNHSLNPTIVPVDYGIKTLDVFDVTYSGYQGKELKPGCCYQPTQKENFPVLSSLLAITEAVAFPMIG